MDAQRFRIATRIHFALLRQFGEDVGVSTLLHGGPEAREALWVCEASNDAQLVALAEQFKRSANAPSEDDAPQDAAWARNTSGFGHSLPPSLDGLPHVSPSPSRGAAVRRPR